MLSIGEGGSVLILYLQKTVPVDYPYDYIFIYNYPVIFKPLTSILP